MSDEHDPRPDDPYSRVNYRSLIAWPARIEREWKFLETALSDVRSVVDLGCGPGEHCRFLAAHGIRAVGVDASAAQIEAAMEHTDEFGELGPRFLHADFTELPNLTEEKFEAALCLGNVLPFLEREDLSRMLDAVHTALKPGAPLIVQLLNYRRILDVPVRHLPLNMREDPNGEGEIVWLRLMKPDGPYHVIFHPTTLLVRPGEDPPVRVHATREVRLRAWTWPEIEKKLNAAGFREHEVFGSMQRDDFDPDQSNDLVFVTRRR